MLKISRLNFRPLLEGSHLPFYRTGSPHHWELADAKFMREELNISYYFDLRTIEEQEKCNFYLHLKDKVDFEHVSAPIDLCMDDFFKLAYQSGLDYANYYIRMLPKAYEVLQKVKQKEAELQPGEKILFGCAAGKDRTGLLALLILKDKGYEDAEIIADYMASIQATQLYLHYFYDENFKRVISEDKFLASMTPKPYVIEVVLDHINTHSLYQG